MSRWPGKTEQIKMRDAVRLGGGGADEEIIRLSAEREGSRGGGPGYVSSGKN